MEADCDLRFENISSNVVYGGQQVAGVVNINVHNVMTVKKLSLLIEGVGECEWTETRRRRAPRGRRRTEITVYKGRSQYMNTIIDLIPIQTEIHPGRHTYNFTFQVPQDAPSSVQQKNGRIYYRILTVFYRPMKLNLEFQSIFVVIRPIDLNLDPQLQFPIQQEDIKNYGRCCVSGPVSLQASISQIGFVAGQKIPIKVSINNPTNIEICYVEVTLEKRIKYASDTPCFKNNYEEFELRRKSHRCAFKRDKKEYGVELEVPQTVPTTNNPLAKVIDISYMLIVRATTSGWRKSLKVFLPVIIGTTPIGSQHTSVPSAPTSDEISNMITTAMVPSAPQDSPDADLPPTYEEIASNVLPSVNTDASASNSTDRPIGFVIPSNANNKA